MKRTALLLLALAACAPMPIDGARLEELAEGRTFAVQRVGNPAYAIISFLPGRQTTWFRLDDQTCYAGTWVEPSPGSLCFTLQNPTRTSCWTYAEAAGQLTMSPTADPDANFSYTPLPDSSPCTPTA